MFRSANPLLDPIVAYLEANGLKILGEDLASPKQTELRLELVNGEERRLEVKYQYLESFRAEEITLHCEAAGVATTLIEGDLNIEGPPSPKTCAMEDAVLNPLGDLDSVRTYPGLDAYSELDLDSLTMYWVARSKWEERTAKSLDLARSQFAQIIGRNPRFAPAHLGFADCIVLLAHAGYSVLKPSTVLDDARQAARSALSLAQDIPTRMAASSTLAQIQLIYDWEFVEAEAALVGVLREYPHHAHAHQGYAHLLISTGRPERALEAIRTARQLSPSSPMIHGTAGWMLHFARRHQESIRHLEQTTYFHASFPPGYVMLGLALEAERRYPAAKEAFQRSFELEPGPVALAALAHVEAVSGNGAQAEAHLEELKTMANTRWVSQYFFAIAHAGFGDAERTLGCLEAATDERCDWMIHAAIEPRWDLFRSDSRFRAILARVGLFPFFQES